MWYYAMVRFRTIDFKLYPIAQFEENRIIRKKMLNSSQVNNEFLFYLDIFPILMLFKVICH